MWNKAREVVDDKDIGEEEFEIISAVKIVEEIRNRFGLPSTDTRMCYNPKLFIEKGWCLTDSSNTRNPGWGFCSPSCRLIDGAVSCVLLR